jgi:hypothetical protein
VRGRERGGQAGIKPSPSVRKRGRPKITDPRPWEAEGISRAQWYRRQAEKRSKP